MQIRSATIILKLLFGGEGGRSETIVKLGLTFLVSVKTKKISTAYYCSSSKTIFSAFHNQGITEEMFDSGKKSTWETFVTK